MTGAGQVQCPGPGAGSPASRDARRTDGTCEGWGGEGMGTANLTASVM